MLSELRRAVVRLARLPGPTLLVVTSLGICLGLNTAAFSFLDAVLLRPFPYSEPEQLYVAWGAPDFQTRRGLPRAVIDRWRDIPGVLGASGFQLSTIRFTPSQAPDGQTRHASMVDGRIFSVLGVAPAIGRPLLPEDSSSVAVLSHSSWLTLFGSRRDIVGQRLSINSRAYTVVGVMPRGFFFPDTNVSVWIPFETAHGSHEEVQAVIRLSSDVRPEAIRSRLDASLGELNPKGDTRGTVGVFSLFRLVVDEHETASWALWATVTAFLLLAIANVSNWLTGRVLLRDREFATHRALGASHWRILRFAALEAALVGCAAAVLGLFLSMVAIRALPLLEMSAIPRVDTVELSQRALAYGIGISILTIGLFGVLPAAASLRVDPAQALHSSQGHSLSRRTSRTMRSLMGAEVGIATFMLATSAVFIHSFVRISTMDWGFVPDRVLAATVTLDLHRVSGRPQHEDFTEHTLTRLRRMPGVEQAATAYGVPIRWARWQQTTIANEEGLQSAGIWTVGTQYFSTLQIPIIAGREWTEDDRPISERTCLVDQRFAREMWGDENAVGKRIALLRPKDDIRQQVRRNPFAAELQSLLRSRESYEADGAEWTVIGVVRNVRMFGVSESTGPAVYMHYSTRDNSKSPVQTFVVRATPSRPITLGALRAALRTDAAIKDVEVFTLDDALSDSIGGRGAKPFLTLVSSFFSALGLIIVGLGTYGVVTVSVGVRRREIAIRRALGAQLQDIFLVVCRGENIAALVGVLFGLGSAEIVARVTQSLLFTDPAVNRILLFGTGAGIVTCITILAVVMPLRAALKHSPAEILRTD